MECTLIVAPILLRGKAWDVVSNGIMQLRLQPSYATRLIYWFTFWRPLTDLPTKCIIPMQIFLRNVCPVCDFPFTFISFSWHGVRNILFPWQRGMLVFVGSTGPHCVVLHMRRHHLVNNLNNKGVYFCLLNKCTTKWWCVVLLTCIPPQKVTTCSRWDKNMFAIPIIYSYQHG